jgi:hypothetical protein
MRASTAPRPLPRSLSVIRRRQLKSASQQRSVARQIRPSTDLLYLFTLFLQSAPLDDLPLVECVPALPIFYLQQVILIDVVQLERRLGRLPTAGPVNTGVVVPVAGHCRDVRGVLRTTSRH